jgi:hypothetical protein
MLENIIWQDIGFMIANVVFAIALIPALKPKSDKPPKLTSLMTGGTLLFISILFATLGLWLASGMTFITAIMWFVIFAQKILYDKKQTL